MLMAGAIYNEKTAAGKIIICGQFSISYQPKFQHFLDICVRDKVDWFEFYVFFFLSHCLWEILLSNEMAIDHQKERACIFLQVGLALE